MRTRSMKRAVSLIAAAALVVAGAGAASAATVEEVPFDEIQDFGDGVYKGWHQEHRDANDSYEWSDSSEGVRLGFNGPAQLLNGLVEAGAPGIETTVDELIDLVQGASVDVAEGAVWFQIGMFQTEDRDGWTTLRPVEATADLSNDETLWTGTGDWHGANAPLSMLLEEAEEGVVYLTGFGVHAQNDAVVSAITWGGTTYQFVEELTQDEDPEVEEPEVEEPDAEEPEDGDQESDAGAEEEDADDDRGAATDDAAAPVKATPSYAG